MIPDKEFNGFLWYPKRVTPIVERCQACGRPNNIYCRKLSSDMARNLVRVYHLSRSSPEQTYFHVVDFDASPHGGDFSLLRFWGLIEEAINEDTAKRASGLWKITGLGEGFVLLRERVPQYILIKWGSEHLGFAGPSVDIRSCLEYKNRFNYAELMGLGEVRK